MWTPRLRILYEGPKNELDYLLRALKPCAGLLSAVEHKGPHCNARHDIDKTYSGRYGSSGVSEIPRIIGDKGNAEEHVATFARLFNYQAP